MPSHHLSSDDKLVTMFGASSLLLKLTDKLADMDNTSLNATSMLCSFGKPTACRMASFVDAKLKQQFNNGDAATCTISAKTNPAHL